MHRTIPLWTTLVSLVLLFSCGTLLAQDYFPVQNLRVEPSPANIDSPVVVRGLFDSGHLGTRSQAVTRAGNTITVEHEILFIAITTPPPPHSFGIPLGLLPEGEYTVVYRARTTEGFLYPVRTLPLVVLGGAGFAVPALSAQAGALLVVVSLALGLWGFRRSR